MACTMYIGSYEFQTMQRIREYIIRLRFFDRLKSPMLVDFFPIFRAAFFSYTINFSKLSLTLVHYYQLTQPKYEFIIYIPLL